VDDVAGIAGVLEAARSLYSLAPDDVNVIGFSQGATVAMALARRLDAARPGAVRRLFLAAGSLASPPDATLAMPGTDIVAYEPGHNWLQAVADLRLGEPPERVFLPELLRIKACSPAPEPAAVAMGATPHATGNEPRIADYACPDGTRVTHIFEPDGEHAWPGQDRKYDSWLTGRGSTSAIDFTGLIADAIAPRGP
jgi:pimeloyl-ACP methyl ester carboxylesterase